ncbi:MAG: hypothetical protein BroJett040_13940 [Oligoflexia bacterium]|nr:MAG: hypothetical protein BroJett040_13940 [Oligoflexia bacterium]
MYMRKINQLDTGLEFRVGSILIFFGNQNSNYKFLHDQYSKILFKRIKQVHGNDIVAVDQSTPDCQFRADALISSEENIGLCISTADCLPIFFFNSDRTIIAGVHSGWRGVALNLVSKVIQNFQSQGVLPKDLHCFIGPHISQEYFEIGQDAFDILQSAAAQVGSSDMFYAKKNEKYFFDLDLLTRYQCQKLGVLEENIFSLNMDTFSDRQFHSYRRDKEKAGRQISFIVRLSDQPPK